MRRIGSHGGLCARSVPAMEICGGSEQPEQSRPASRIVRHCRWCPVSFIGQDAIGAWSQHTWSHWDELVESQLLAGVESKARGVAPDETGIGS